MSKSLTTLALLLPLALLSGCTKLTLAVKGRLSNGQQEMKSALQAKQSAQSWKMKTRLAVHDNFMETEFEVSCPDRERITTTIGNDRKEMRRIGKTFYLNQAGTWYFLDVNDTNWSPCGSKSGEPSPWAMLNEGREMVTVFANAPEKFKYSRGDVRDIAGTKCQEWNVEFGDSAHAGGMVMAYHVCLAPDHRPVYVVMGQGGLVTEYSDWNQVFQIEVPPNAVPYQEPVGTPTAVPQHHGQ